MRLSRRVSSSCDRVGPPGAFSSATRRSTSGSVFTHPEGVTREGVPDENVLCLPLQGDVPVGEVWHHPAFLTEA